MIEWHIKTPEELERTLETDLKNGLSQETASLRGEEQKNILFSRKQKNKSYYAKQMMIVLLPLLLLITSAAALLTGEKTVGYTLLFSSLFCVLCLFAAYSRARRLLETAEESANASCRVLRDGAYCMIPQESLVTGDIVYLQKGDFVAGDCRLIASASLVMREGGITSQKFAKKDAKALAGSDIYTAPNMVWAGTAVEEGMGLAVVCQVGGMTHLRQTLEVTRTGGLEDTPLFRQLNKISSVMTITLLAILFASAILGFFSLTKGDFLENWMLIAAFAASAMADFYGVFAYIAAGHALYGIQRRNSALREGVLAKHAESLDELASLNRLFLTPDWFVPPFSAKTAYLAEPFGRGEAMHKELLPFAEHILRDAALALGEVYQSPTEVKPSEEASDIATWKQCVRDSLSFCRKVADMTTAYQLVASGQTKKGICYGAVLRENRLMLVLAAKTEKLLPLCRYAYRDGKPMEIDQTRRERIFATEQHILSSCEKGVRDCFAICVGILAEMPNDGRLSDEFIETAFADRLAFEGFVALETAFHVPSVRALKEALSRKMGITLFCENERDLRIAEKLGLPQKKTAPFARGESGAILDATRREKLVLLRAAKKNGEKVAYAGEGFDDLPHMKEADSSLSLGAWQLADEVMPLGKGNKRERMRGKRLENFGCDAFCHSADLLVSYPESRMREGMEVGKGGFYSLYESILHAGGFFYNVRAVFAYLAFSASVKLLPALISLFVTGSLISPEALALMGLVFDPLAALSFAFSAPSSRSHGYVHDAKVFADTMIRTAISGLVGGALMVALYFVLPAEEAVSGSFTVSALLLLSLTAFLMQTALLKQPLSILGGFTLLGGAAALMLYWFVWSSFGLLSILFTLLLLVVFLAVKLMAMTVKK